MLEALHALLARSPWWAYSIAANAAIIRTEYVNRHAHGGWAEALPDTWYLIALAQLSLYYSFNGAPHWMTAWAFFSVGNALMRAMAVNWTAGHEVSSWAAVSVGIAAMLAGSLVLKAGLR